jgi:electron transport complex protein RnfC
MIEIKKRRTFSGGVHLHYFKEFTKDKAIESMPIPKRVVLPLSQHLGAPSQPIVEAGAEVQVGQQIAKPGGFVSVPLHATISGKVISIGRFPHPNGHLEESIVIEGDGREDDVPPVKERERYLQLENDELRKIIQEAGLVGLGGAAFPTHVKLSPPKDKPIDTLIINGAECEPYLTADHRLMLEQTTELIDGTLILKKILNPQKIFIGIEENKMEAVHAVAEATMHLPDVEVAILKVKYPQGGEKQLIKALTGREVPPPPGLPMDVACLVHNVATTISIAQAVKYSRPLIDKIVTVSGSAIKEPKNVRVRIGTLMHEVIEFCGGLTEEAGKIIIGGPMMGLAQYDMAVPVLKGTSGILIFTKDEIGEYESHPCIHCGKCVEVCPVRLTPSEMGNYVENGMMDKAEELGVMECIECGSCSYICPSKRWLVQFFRLAKAEINARRRKEAAKQGSRK